MTKPIIRCSSLDRILSCSGSYTLEALESAVLDVFADTDGNSMTWRGNWCHYQSAMRLLLDHGAVAPDGLPKPSLPKDWKPTVWDERAVEWYVSSLLPLVPEGHAIFVERHLTLEFPRFILSGHIDAYDINAEGTAFNINDLKTGVNEVDIAEQNWQLAGYAALLKSKHPNLVSGTARIFQQNAETPISEAAVDNLTDLVNFMESKVNAALDNLLTLETGYKQCRLCKPVTFCPAIKKEIELMKITLSPEELAAITVSPNLKDLAEVAAAGRAIAGPIATILESLKARVALEGEVELHDGTVVRVVEEPGRRKVTHPQVAHAFASQKVGEDAAWDAMDMSLTRLEDKLVDAGMKRTSKKEESAQGWIKDNLSHIIERGTVKKLKFT